MAVELKILIGVIVIFFAGCCFGFWWSSRKLKRLGKLSLNGSKSLQLDQFKHWKLNRLWFWRFAKSSFFIAGPFLLVLGFLNSLLYPAPKVHRSYNDLTGKFEQSYEEAHASPIGLIFWIPFLISLIGLIFFLVRSRKAVSKLDQNLRTSLKEKMSLFPVPRGSNSPSAHIPKISTEVQAKGLVDSPSEGEPKLDLETSVRDLAYLRAEVEKDFQRYLNEPKDPFSGEPTLGEIVKKAEPLHRAVFETVRSNPELTLAEISESSGVSEKAIKSIMRAMNARHRVSQRSDAKNEVLPVIEIPSPRPKEHLRWVNGIRRHWKPASVVLLILIVPSVFFRLKNEQWKKRVINMAHEEGRVLIPEAESKRRYLYNPSSWVFGQPSTYRFMENEVVGSDRDTSDFRGLTVTSYTYGEEEAKTYFYVFGKARKTVAFFLTSDRSDYQRVYENSTYWDYSAMKFGPIEDERSNVAILDFMSPE